MTALDQALALIKSKPGVRTPEIARLLKMHPHQVDLLLDQHRADGTLITCEVEIGDGQRVIEYRCSTAGAQVNPWRPHDESNTAAVRAPDRAPKPETTPSPATAAALQEVPMATKPLAERIVDVLTKHGACTLEQIARHADTTVGTLYTMMGSLKKKHGVVKYQPEGSGTAATYALGTGKPVRMDKPKDALEAGAERGRKKPGRINGSAPFASGFGSAIKALDDHKSHLLAQIAKLDRAIEAIKALA